MDRRYGGDPLAPPRPPKNQPRVHRPKAPEPTIMSVPQQQHQQQQQQLITNNFPIQLQHQHQLHHQHQHQHQHQQQQLLALAPTTAPLIPLVQSSLSFSRRRPPPPNINNINLSTISTLSQPPQLLPPPPLLSLSNIHNNQEPQLSPVTLAAPRPENERLANEYVDTPFRPQNLVSQRSATATTTTTTTTLPTSTSTPTHNISGNEFNNNRTIQTFTIPRTATAASTFEFLSTSGIGISTTHNDVINSTAAAAIAATTTASPTISAANLRIGSQQKSFVPSQHHNHSTISSSPLAATTTISTAALPMGTTTSNPLRNFNIKNNSSSNNNNNNINNNNSNNSNNSNSNINSRTTALPITKQPKSSTIHIQQHPIKDIHMLHDDIELHPSNGDSLNSVSCPLCKRCRCDNCQRPRPLPSRWICGNKYLCSAETIIDYATCLCCAKALFYHCSKDCMDCDGDSISCADDPCSCSPHKRTQRWAWLGALSLVLPCLWCYWPMRGCTALCAKCYARHSRHGCRCSQSKINNSIIGGGSGSGTMGGGGGIGSLGGGISGSGIGVSGNNNNNNNNNNIIGGHSARTITHCDFTPEKRLLDSSPEY